MMAYSSLQPILLSKLSENFQSLLSFIAISTDLYTTIITYYYLTPSCFCYNFNTTFMQFYHEIFANITNFMYIVFTYKHSLLSYYTC